MDVYVYPTIIALPLGYDCTVEIPVDQIGARLTQDSGTAKVQVSFNAVCDGETILEDEVNMTFKDGRLIGDAPQPFRVVDRGGQGAKQPGYLEMAVSSPDSRPIFLNKRVFGLYTIYSCRGKKSFVSDNAYKYGSPPIIGQMAKFGQYVDAYPVIHIDKDRDLGETLVLINPYKRPIIADVLTHDERKLSRVRVPPKSTRNVDMGGLLKEGESQWSGHIQLTASNRLITFNFKHSFKDSTVISDFEHLDPYRSDPTHQPMTLVLRKWLGGKLRERA